MEYESFKFKLKNAADYHYDGMKCSSDELTLYEPAEKHRAYAVPLQMRYTKIILDLVHSQAKKKDSTTVDDEPAGKKLDNKDNGLDADSILMIIMGSSVLSKNEFSDMMSDFRGLMLSSDICLIDDKIAMPAAIFDRLTMREKNRLFAEYLLNFMSPSVVSQK